MNTSRTAALLLAAVMLLPAFTACRRDHSVSIDSGTESGNSGVTVTEPETDAPETEAGEIHDLVISELMADNHKLCMGNSLDWAEVFNRGDTAVSLDGWFMTDKPENPYKFSLSGITVEAGGYAVISFPAAGNTLGLSGKGETLYLTYHGKIVDEMTFTAEIGADSWTHEGVAAYPTPGFPNTPEGYEAYLDTLTLPDLRITEAMTSNDSVLPYDGEYYDWVELYNGGSTPILLSDYCLADSHKELLLYTLPDDTIAPGEYYIIYCSGLSARAHAPFRLSSGGETVYLTRKADGVLTDCVVIPGDLKRNESYGRYGNRFFYMEEPTPAAENKEGIARINPAPAADQASGAYESAVTVALTGSGTIYYTTDGTLPTVNSAVYTAPVTLTKSGCIRAMAVSDGHYSPVSSYTYLIGVEHTLPVVEVTVPAEYVSASGEKSMLVNYMSKIEAGGSIAYFENGKEMFSVGCGLRLHGNGSREGLKKSFQLRFRSEYGAGKLKYQVFDGLDIAEFDSLLLHSSSEDYPCANMRDEFMETLAAETSLYTQATKPVILYINGDYYGVYYLRERISDEYIASHLNVSADSVDLIESYSVAEYGSARDYDALLNYAQTHDLTVSEYYTYVTDRIDAQSLMDWYIVRTFTGDKDYANIRYFRSSESDGKWRWISFDLDWGFWHTDDHPLSDLIRDDHRNVLMWNLLKNPDFRDAFLRRYAELLNTTFEEQHVLSVIEAYVTAIRPEMEMDRPRWGATVSSWEKYVQLLRDYVAGGRRRRTVLSDIQSFFSLTDAQMTDYFG